MSFRPITKDEALAIHSAVVARFGGIDGVRDEGLLESALAQPFQTPPIPRARTGTRSPTATKEPPPPSWVRTSGCPGANSSHLMPSFLKPCSARPMVHGTSNR